MRSSLGGVLVALLIFSLLACVWIFDRPVTADDPPQVILASRELGVWDGRLALFETGDPLPKTVYDVWISTLPPGEQDKLIHRVPVTDEDMLWALLEDYTG